MAAKLYIKDPNSVLDYKWNWASWLQEGETITAATVTAEEGITVDSSSDEDGTVTAWLSGGTDGRTYRVVNQITTSQGRVDERTIRIVVEDR
jgi:hypothetical protein